MSNYGMPYMGSKDGIISSISPFLPEAENFYDIFGGGGSVTHFMMLNKSNKYRYFHYNEIVESTANLFKDAIDGKYSYDIFKPEWVSRDDFFKRKDHDAYIRICWSFGNIQRCYLFGKEIEQYKRSIHQAVVFSEFNDIAIKYLGIKSWPTNVDTIKKRRAYLRQKIKFNFKLEKIGRIKRLQQLEQLERLQQLQQLQRLERLQQLEQLEQLERLVITSKSYDQIEIKPNSVIYCDPPYKNTTSYLNSFNKNLFLDWAANIDYPLFISEYDINDSRFDLIYTVEKRSMLSADKTVGNKLEKLYWNRK